MLIDTHAHINDEVFQKDFDRMLARARRSGVESIIDVGYNRKTIRRSQILSADHIWIYSAFGFHPHEAKTVTEEDYAWLAEQLQNRKCVALGEIGLDAVKEHSPLPSQEKVFARLLEIAKSSGKPVILHSRGAERKVLDLIAEAGLRHCVFHCYTGNGETAKAITQKGFFLSFTGTISFGKEDLSWIKQIPQDRLFIETDCPYLAPEPHRGKTNEPSFLSSTCDRLAEILGITPNEVARITTANAKAFFRI